MSRAEELALGWFVSGATCALTVWSAVGVALARVVDAGLL